METQSGDTGSERAGRTVEEKQKAGAPKVGQIWKMLAVIWQRSHIPHRYVFDSPGYFLSCMWLLGKTWSRFSSRGVIVVKNVRAGRSIHRKCTPEPSQFADEKEQTHNGRGSARAPPHRADGTPGAPSPTAFPACLLTALSSGAGRGRVERARRRCP